MSDTGSSRLLKVYQTVKRADELMALNESQKDAGKKIHQALKLWKN